MKKKKFLLLGIILLLCGCGKVNKDNIIKDFEKDINNSKAYKISGNMEIINDEDTFKYNIEAYYLKDDFYKVIMVNETNNHEQIILRNKEGVYVITPSLNKSFKFDSVWPSNSSQSYLLGPILNDINNDDKNEYIEEENFYIIKSTVNYPNNADLTYQKVYFNKNKVIDHLEVYNKDNIVKIKMNFTSIDMKADLKESDFALENYIDEETNASCKENECDKTTSSVKEIIYPLYVPSNTYLKGSDTISNEDTERVILTFSGDSNFVIVEESINTASEFEIIPVNGDPLIINDVIGAVSSNSIYWTSSGKDYYLVSNDLSTNEIIEIATSLGSNVAVSSTK